MLFFNMIITMAIYLLLPLILIKIGKPMSRFQINLVSFLNLLVGIFASSILVYIFSSGSRVGSGGGAILWTLVGNVIMKKYLALKTDPADIKFNEKERRKKEKIDSAITEGKYASENDMNKRQGLIGLCIIAFVLIIFIFIVFILGPK